MEEFISVYQHGILLGGSHSQVAWKADHEVKMGTQEAYGEVLLKSTLEWKKGSWIKLGWGAGLGCHHNSGSADPTGIPGAGVFRHSHSNWSKRAFVPSPLCVAPPPPATPPALCVESLDEDCFWEGVWCCSGSSLQLRGALRREGSTVSHRLPTSPAADRISTSVLEGAGKSGGHTVTSFKTLGEE